MPRSQLVVSLVLLFATAPLAGCIGADDPAQPADLSSTMSTPVLRPENGTGPDETPLANASLHVNATPAASKAVPEPPDPCATPVRGLDHPCLSDGLDVGEAVFWSGGALPDWRTSAGALDYLLGGGLCAETTGCTEHTFVVGPTTEASQLRVDVRLHFADPSYVRTGAVDALLWTPETALVVELFAPGALESEAPVPADRADVTGMFAQSLFVGGYDERGEKRAGTPEPGTWTVRLSGALPSDLHHELRASLQEPAPPSDELAFPDLQIIPPFEVGFMVPTSSFMPGAATGVATPGATCMAEELAEAQQNGLERPLVCLRFSMGFYNAGDGALRLRAVRDGTNPAAFAEEEAGLTDVPLVQNVCTADGRRCTDVPDLDARTRYHNTHLHYHYQNAYVFDLYRVQAGAPGTPPTLVHVSTSGKLGINPASEAIAGWDRFDQRPPSAPRGTDAEGNPSPTDQRLQAGWGDVYDWNRGGNYLPVPVDDELRPLTGEFVIRGRTDPDGQVLETDEENNVAYTHFRVSGLGDVEILERGHGTDPWDPARSVLALTP